MAHAASQLNNKKIDNLGEYLYLKDVRAKTGLINGKIIYDGLQWSEEEYNRRFPEPVLKYKIINLDGTQIEK